MAELWRQIFAPEAYVDVVSAVMLRPDRAVSTSSLWSGGGSTEVSEPSSSQRSVAERGFRSLKREAESSPVMQSVDLDMEDVIKPRLEPTSKRRAIEVKGPSAEPSPKAGRLLQVPSTPGGTSTPRSVNFSEVIDTIGVSDTLNKQFEEDILMRKRDFGKVKPREEVSVEIIPTATTARAMSWDEFIVEEPKPELVHEEGEELVEAARSVNKIRSEERAKSEAEQFFECKHQRIDVPSPSPAGVYSLTDLSSDIQEKLAKYIEPAPVAEPTVELREPALVGIQTPKKAKLRPVKFGRHEQRVSFMAVPDVIKLNLPPLSEGFNEVAVVVPTEEEERVEIKVPVEQAKEAMSKGKAARVSVQLERENAKIEMEVEAVPVQVEEARAPEEWKAAGEAAQQVPRDVQAGGVEIAIPLQSVFEALHERVPAEGHEAKAVPKEQAIKEQEVSVKGRKKTKRAKKRERALQLPRGKPLLEEQPEVKVSEVKHPDGRQSVIMIESMAQVEKEPSEPVKAEPPSADEAAVAGTKPRPSVVEIKVVPSEEQGMETALGLGTFARDVSEKPRVLAKAQGPSQEWTAVGEAKVVSLERPEAKKLEILLPTESVFEPLEGEKVEVVTLPKPVAPRGQPHKAEHERQQKVHFEDALGRQTVPSAEADQQEKALRRSIILSPASPLTIQTGEQQIVLKSIPSSAELSKEAGKLRAATESENQRIINAVHDDVQRLGNELANHFEQLANNFESKNRELSQQLTSVSEQLAHLQQSIKESAKERPSLTGPSTTERAVKKPKVAKTKKGVPVTEPLKLGERTGLCNPPSINLEFFEPSLFQEVVKLKSLSPPSQPLESPFSSLYTEHIGLCNPPSVNLEFFEPSLFEVTEHAPKGVQKRHPSVDLTFFEPSLFATPEVTEKLESPPAPTKHEAAKKGKKPTFLSRIAKGIRKLVKVPAESPEKYDVQAPEVAPEEYAVLLPSAGLQELEPLPPKVPKEAVEASTRARHPSVDLQYFEPKLFAPPPIRHPSIDLQYFESSMFETPKTRPASPREAHKVHPSIQLTPFEPSLFATPVPVGKPLEAVTLKPSERVTGTGLVESRVKEIEGKVAPLVSHAPGQIKAKKVHPSVNLQYFEPSLFNLPEALPKEALPKEALPKEALPKEAVSKEALPEEALPKEALPKEALPKEAVSKEALPKKKKRSWIKRVIDKLFRHKKEALPEESVSKEALPKEALPKEALPKEALPKEALPKEALPKEAVSKEALPEEAVSKEAVSKEAVSKEALPKEAVPKKKKRSWIKRVIDKLFRHKKDEKYLARKRAKKEAKAAKKEEKKAAKQAKKEAKKSKSPQVIQLEPIEVSKAKPKTHPSVDLTFFEPSLFATPKPKPSTPRAPTTESRGIAPIAMAAPLQQPYTHFARPVMMQQPARPLSSHEYNVQRLRQPSKIAFGRPSVDLQFFEPSLFEEAPRFKPPQAKEKSPLMEESEEMSAPEVDSIWSTLLACTDTPELRQQARESIFAGSGIPAHLRPSLWLTLSGGAPTHTVCYRRLSHQSEPITDNLYAMTKRLSTALDSYYKSLSGHSFEYPIESLVIHLITRTVQLPDSGAPLDSAILYQEEQTFALALNLLYGQKYRLAAAFTRHGLREWCYELDRILEHEDTIVHPPSLAFAAPWFQGLFFNVVSDEEAGLILDWFILEGRSALFRLAVAMESNPEYLFDIARDLKHITNTQLDTLHDSFESAWEQRRLQLHHEHKERSEVDHELVVLNSLSNLDKEIQRLYHSQHQLRNKLDSERDQRTALEHANEDLIYRLHDRGTGRQPHL